MVAYAVGYWYEKIDNLRHTGKFYSEIGGDHIFAIEYQNMIYTDAHTSMDKKLFGDAKKVHGRTFLRGGVTRLIGRWNNKKRM